MSIHAVCPECGTDYRFKDEAAGRQIRCKVCTAVFRVTAQCKPDAAKRKRDTAKLTGRRSTPVQSSAASTSSAPSPRPASKPKPKRKPTPAAVPQRLPPRVKLPSSRRPPSSERDRQSKRKPQSRTKLTFELPFRVPKAVSDFVRTIVCICLLLVIATIHAWSSPHFSNTLARNWLFLGYGIMFVGFVWGAWVAFRESVLCGVLFVLIPCYRLYYLLTRWNQIWRPLLVNVSGHATVYAGWYVNKTSGKFLMDLWIM